MVLIVVGTAITAGVGPPVVDVALSVDSNSRGGIGHESPFTGTGARAVGFHGGIVTAGNSVGLMLAETEVVFTPARLGAEWPNRRGLRSSSVRAACCCRVPLRPRRGRAAGPAVRGRGTRQVMLAGGPGTTALTEGGAEGQVLTYHGRRKPTWEAPSGGGLEVAEADGAPDVAGVTRLELVGASLTDDGGGQVTVAARVNAGGVSYGDDGDISTLAYEDEPAAGALDAVARADHVHGMPAAASPGKTTSPPGSIRP